MALQPNEIRDWSIYRITNPNGRVYIGITSDMQKRMSVYRSDFSIGKSKQTLVYNSVKKYGFPSHELRIIDSFKSDKTFANGKEMFWIRTYMSNKNKFPEQNGMNLTNGGDGLSGYKPTPEMNERNRQRKIGGKASEETKRKMSEARKGVKMNFTHYTPEFIEGLRVRGKKLRHTEEAKRKIGDAAKGNKYAVGYKMTPKQIEHRSSLIRGRKVTGEALIQHTLRVQKSCGKVVLQYDLSGNFIKEYPFVKKAAEEIGIPRLGIFRNLSGKYKQSRGFIFKYK